MRTTVHTWAETTTMADRNDERSGNRHRDTRNWFAETRWLQHNKTRHKHQCLHITGISARVRMKMTTAQSSDRIYNLRRGWSSKTHRLENTTTHDQEQSLRHITNTTVLARRTCSQTRLLSHRSHTQNNQDITEQNHQQHLHMRLHLKTHMYTTPGTTACSMSWSHDCDMRLHTSTNTCPGGLATRTDSRRAGLAGRTDSQTPQTNHTEQSGRRATETLRICLATPHTVLAGGTDTHTKKDTAPTQLALRDSQNTHEKLVWNRLTEHTQY